jgi:hypothetical protein
MSHLTLTNHATHRMQQRGINNEIINIIMQEADKGKYCKGNAYSMYVSKKKINSLLNKKTIKPKQAEKLNGVVLIESEGVILTTFHKTKKVKYN